MTRTHDVVRRCQWLVAAACSLIMITVAHPAAGQEDAGIFGRVTDESGAVLPGVTVTASSPALQVREMSVVTDERGEYRITPLPIGSFDVVYSLSGFQAVRREGLRLTTGFTAKVDVVLKIGGLEESITVSGLSPVVDVTSTTTATQLTRETLELTPTSRNGLIGLMAQAPGVRPNLDIGGNTINTVPAFHAFGQDGESWQTIEGVVTMSPRSGTQSGNYWDYSSLEETRVQTVGSDAEVPNRGIYMSLITKSGGNSFHGGGYWAQTNHNLQSDNIDAALAAQGITAGNPVETRRDLSAELGGRIVKDRLWFYYSARRRDEVDDILNAFKPDGTPSTQTQLQAFSTEKLSYQLSKGNRLVGFSQWSRKSGSSGASQFVPWDSRQTEKLNSYVSKAEWQSIPASNVVLDSQLGYWTWGNTYTGHLPNTVATVDQLSQAVTGQTTADGQRPVEYRYHTKFSASWYKPNLLLGNHQLKGGLEYGASRADRPWVSRGTAGDYQMIYRNGAPFQIAAFNYPVTPIDRSHYVGLYAQDAWTIARRLTLNLGLRYAHDNGFIPEQCRVEAAPPANVVSPAACFARIQFNVWNPIVPRLHAAYDVSGDGKTVIKGGWGRFAHMRAVDELQQANPNVATQTTYTWHDLNGDRLYQAGEVDLNPNGPDFVSTNLQGGGAPANGVPNPDEREPMTDELSLSLERELWPNFSVRGTGVYSRVTDAYRLQNNRRPYSAFNIPIANADPGRDGRTGTADDPGQTITYFEYSAAYAGAAFQQSMLINDSAANQTYRSVEVAVSKRFSNSWQFQGSYSATKKQIPLIVTSGGGLTLGVNTLDPNAEINTSDNTWEWLGRLSGAYRARYDVVLSANYERRSGAALARTVSFTGGKQIPSITVRVEPIGSIRLPDINLLDLRVEKSFRIAGQQKVAVRLNIFNAANINTVTGETVLSGTNFGRATGIVLPRTFELSASYNF